MWNLPLQCGKCKFLKYSKLLANFIQCDSELNGFCWVVVFLFRIFEIFNQINRCKIEVLWTHDPTTTDEQVTLHDFAWLLSLNGIDYSLLRGWHCTLRNSRGSVKCSTHTVSFVTTSSSSMRYWIEWISTDEHPHCHKGVWQIITEGLTLAVVYAVSSGSGRHLHCHLQISTW